MRVKYKAWANDFLNDHPQVVVAEPDQYRGRWQDRFEKVQPLHVEVGAGKGRFVMEMAKKHPEWNFVAIERQPSVIIRALEKWVETPLENVQLICMDAKNLDSVFADNEVDEFYLNFSDPWPKHRHAKRRLTSETFLDSYKPLLKSTGHIQFKTDNRSLFEYSLLSFSAYPVQLKEVYLDLHQEEDIDNVQTEYEEKFARRGQVIYKAVVQFYEK